MRIEFISCDADAAGHGERRLVGNRQREPDGKRRADAEGRLDPDLAAHLLDDPLADREAQPRAAILRIDRCVRLREIIKQPADLVGRKADAGIANRDFDARPTVGGSRYSGLQSPPVRRR